MAGQAVHYDSYENQVSFNHFITGETADIFFNDHFSKFNDDLNDYPLFAEDHMDYVMTTSDNFERTKPFKADKKGRVIGDWYAFPVQDKDDRFMPNTMDMDNMFSDPPDSNLGPACDHKLDEDPIWNFNYTSYNQYAINNEYKTNFMQMMERNSIPFWSDKLLLPSYKNDASLKKLYTQWNQRIGLETLKMRHSLVNSRSPIVADQQSAEISQYIENCKLDNKLEEASDVFITDRKPRDKKFQTNSLDESKEFFEYKKALEEYNSDIEPIVQAEEKSIPQHVVPANTLPSAKRLDDGSLFLKILDSDLKNDEQLLKKFEQRKTQNEELFVAEEEEEDEDDDDEDDDDDDDDDDEGYNSVLEGYNPDDPYYIELMDQNNEIRQELEKLDKSNIFASDEEYDVIKDMQRGFNKTLKSTMTDRMIDQLPDHYFHDIKVPLDKEVHFTVNENNPLKPTQFRNFFEWRENYAYFEKRRFSHNLEDHNNESKPY